MNFRTLFHPLTRVLFNFPSGYLFAIGVPHVFSLGSVRTLPPSRNRARLRYSLSSFRPTGPHRSAVPIRGRGPASHWNRCHSRAGTPPFPPTELRPQLQSGFRPGLRPFRSPLLGASRLISLLPLNDMLKFSGFSDAPPGTIPARSAPRCWPRQHATEERQLRSGPRPEGCSPPWSAVCIRRVGKSIDCKSSNLTNVDSSFIDVEP